MFPSICLIMLSAYSMLPYSQSHKLEIISILPHRIAAVGVSLMYTGPALELAVESANRVYGSNLTVSLRLIYALGNVTCNDEESLAADSLAKYYYNELSRDSCVAIIGSCKLPAIPKFFPFGKPALFCDE